MAEQVLMIALSPTMEEGTLVRWHKKEGDEVDTGDVLCEVETDKATMDYESTAEGTLLKILVQEGDQAAIGDVIAIIGEEGENIDHLLGDSSQKEATGDSSQKLDVTGESAGDSSQKYMEMSKSSSVNQDRTEIPGAASASAGDSRIKASPLARKIADINELPLGEISGSGPGGRIVKSDVERFMKAQSVQRELVQEEQTMRQQPEVGFSASKAPSISYVTQAFPEDVEIPISTKRKVIAQRLSESKYNAPHYYLTLSAAVDNLIQIRKSLNESRSDKISFNAFLIKFVAEALKKYPMVNASWTGTSIIVRKKADIGLAVAQSDGLITPVVRDCGNKGITAIHEELRSLIEKAQNNKLMPEEYQNASFSISNLGSFGIEEFTAVINPPGSAILAVGQMKKVPVVDQDDNITVQTQMKLTLSCDHRVIDGAVGADFLRTLKEIIEDPIRALF
jgi:pyruvate dehydrogenase E2 component (dihydrolipoamide acetyltransferase)